MVAFAIFVLSTSLFAQEKTSKVEDAEMKAALKMMNAYLDALNIPVKDVVNLEAVMVRGKKNKTRIRTNVFNIKNRKMSYREKNIFGFYVPTRSHPVK